MIRLTSQRGVSLMLLIIAITVFAAVAIGTVTLLRARHESYPYQVQSYQALALADAGVQFASTYAMDNGAGFASYPDTYIGPTYSAKNTYSLGNGQFQLRYEPATSCEPGKLGNLYCKGVVGTATREVRITDFGAMIGKLSGNHLLDNPAYTPWQEKYVNDWGGSWPGVPFSGWGVGFKMCGVGQYYGQGNIWIVVDSVKVAVSYPPGHPCQINPPQGATPCANPLYLGRLAVTNLTGFGGDIRFAWDEVCDRSTSGMGSSKEITMPHWDGITVPPPAGQSVNPTWNVRLASEYHNNGPRARNYPYCTSSHTIDVGVLWNSDDYPIKMEFVLNEPPVDVANPANSVKYYLEYVTIYNDATGWHPATNRHIFYVKRKNY